MGFRRGGAGKRRDAIEPAVIQALNAIGVRTWQINGRALPDLLCLHRRRWVPLGVKSGEKARLTAAERLEPPSWVMVHSVEEALAVFQVPADAFGVLTIPPSRAKDGIVNWDGPVTLLHATKKARG